MEITETVLSFDLSTKCLFILCAFMIALAVWLGLNYIGESINNKK